MAEEAEVTMGGWREATQQTEDFRKGNELRIQEDDSAEAVGVK